MAQTNQITIEDIKKRVRQFIIDNFLFGSEDVPFTDEDSFLEKGFIDSTGVLELIEFIEENYSLKAEDDELIPENFDTLGNISKYIMRKISRAS